MKTEEIDSKVRQITSVLKASGVRRVGVFGSVLRNEERSDSDIDIYLEFGEEQKTYDHLFQVSESLEEVFDRHVDVVTADSLSRHIGPKILATVHYVDIRS